MTRVSPRVALLLLAASVLCNFLLVGVLALQKPHAPLPAVPESPVLLADQLTTVPSTVTASTFHWKQLETPDFNDYVSRLRAIGCPEPTIQDIVRGEVRDIYAEKQSQLKQSPARATSGSTPTADQNALTRQLASLTQEETAVVASILRTDAERAAIAAEANAARQVAADETASRLAEISQPVRLPLAVRDLYRNAPDLHRHNIEPTPPMPEGHQMAIALVQEQFVKEMSTELAQPSDPGYALKWAAAQVAADELLKLQIGDDAYNKMQVVAAQQEEQERLQSTSKASN